MMSNKHKCLYNSNFTEEEMNALSWLSSLVARGAQLCSPEAQQFQIAHNAMGKLFKKLDKQHDLLHAKDAELKQAEIVTAGLLGLSRTVREDGTLN